MLEGRHQLLAWIQRAKLQKQQAAALLGISKPFMSHLLNGHRRPTLPIAVRIEAQTGIPVAAWVPLTRGKAATQPAKSRKQPQFA